MSLYDDTNEQHLDYRERWRSRGNAVTAELGRATALFQARAIATVIGAPMPDPAAFKRDGPPE